MITWIKNTIFLYIYSFCLIFCQFQPGVAYKSVAYIKKCVVLDNKFVFSNCEKYIVLWFGKIYLFSCLFTQHKVAKG